MKIILVSFIIIRITCLLKTTLSLNLSVFQDDMIFPIYHNASINSNFIYELSQSSDCETKNQFFVNKNSTVISISYDNAEERDSFLKNSNITVSSMYHITETNFSFDISNNNKSSVANLNNNNLLPEIQDKLILSHMCNSNLVNDTQLWDILKISFNDKNKTHSFNVIKFCQLSKIRYGQIISGLLIFSLAIIFVYFSTNVKLRYNQLTPEVEEETFFIESWQAIVFIFLASAVLILIYYFIEYMNLVLTLLITVQSGFCLYFLLITLTNNKKPNNNVDSQESETNIEQSLEINTDNNNNSRSFNFCNKRIELNWIICLLPTIVIMIFWFITRNWIVNNLLCFSIVFVFLEQFQLKKFKIAVILLGSLFFYDAFWVFYSEKIFKTNVMVTVANSVNLPMKLEFPIFLGNLPVKHCLILGLGDLVMPGLLIRYCRRYDFIKNTGKNLYHIISMILYTISLLALL